MLPHQISDKPLAKIKTQRFASNALPGLVVLCLNAVLVPAASAALHDPADHPGKSHSAEATAHYIANEGVMIVHSLDGQTKKIVFDPLFDNVYGQYQPVPEDRRAALITGTAPYDDIDLILISHYHGDHFSPEQMLTMLTNSPDITLVAPGQAIEALAALDKDHSIENRVIPLNLDYNQSPVTLDVDGIQIETVRIPHAGGEARRIIQNMLYRVSLDGQTTVLHMGDADPDDVHFAPYEDLWMKRATDMAFPPYWFFLTPLGPSLLTDRLGATQSVGVHVPEAMPDDPAQRAEKFQGLDLFTEPGETREIHKE